MVPLLKKKPQLWRTLGFVPVAALGAFLGFAILEVATESFWIAMPGGILLGIGLALLVCGVPRVTLPKVKLPKVPPGVRPWLWFPVTAVLSLLLYFLLGLALMPVGLSPTLLVFVTLGAALVLGGAAAYFLTGFPNLYRQPKGWWERVPVEKRPLFFWPLGLVLSVLFFVGIGYAMSLVFGGDSGAPRSVMEDYLPLIAIGTSIPLGCGLAYLLVGFPKPKKDLRRYLPKVPPRAWPALFAGTFLLLGPVFGFPVGYALSAGLPQLPTVLLFPLSLLVGYALSFAAAALAWGLPSRWEKEGVHVGLPANTRAVLFVPVTVLVTGFVVLVFATMGLDLGIGTLVGLPFGLAAGFFASGLAGAVAARRREGTLLAELPEKFKVLVLVSVWLIVGGVVFFGLGMAGLLPPWNLLAGVSVGLAAAILLVEESTLKFWLDERRAERDRRRRLKALRAERLGKAKPAATEARTLKPAVAGAEATAPASKKRFGFPFAKRR